MAIDAGVFAQFGERPKSFMDYRNELDAQAANALALKTNRLQYQGALQAQQDDAAYRDAARNFGADSTENLNMLRARGLAKQATAYEKSMLDAQKARADIYQSTASGKASEAAAAKSQFETYQAKIGTGLKILQSGTSPQAVLQNVQQAVQMGMMSPEDAQRNVSDMPQDPAQFMKWRENQLMQGMDIAKRLELQRQAAQQQEQVRHNKATEALTARGQDKLDARARESNAAAMTKPFEVTGPDGAPVLVQQDKQGNIVPVQGYTPKGGTAKPLPGAVLKQITEVRDNAATIDRLASSFKPEYAGKGVFGLGADMQIGASANLGVDKDSVDWWKNYRKQAELVERHAMFGASLTTGEQAAWRSADVAPGMAPAVVERNLKTRASLAKKVFENTQQDLIDAGHSEKRIGAIAGRSTQVNAPAQASGPAKINSDAEYNALPSGATFVGPDGKTRRKP